MVDRFFDTSAAAKHYRAEVGTPAVDALLGVAGDRHLLSDLSIVELHSVLARLARTGQITLAEFHLARGQFLADAAGGVWQVVSVTPAQFHGAQQLLVRYALSRSLRTLDALQLATALDANATHPLAAFVCADANLCLVATAEGLTVVNPEAP